MAASTSDGKGGRSGGGDARDPEGATTAGRSSDEAFREKVRFGLTEEEMKEPWEAMFSEGIMKLWNARQAMIASGQMADDEDGDEETLYDKEFEDLGEDEANRRKKIRERRRQRVEEMMEIPAWQQISGLFPETEPGMSPNERAGAIYTLVKKVEGLLRFEIKYDHENKEKIAAFGFRTYLWDPLRAVCFHLGISQRRLSMYCKELTGMSAVEMVDRIKAEWVRGKMREELRTFLLTAEAQRRRERKDGKQQVGRRQEAGGRSDGTEAPSPPAPLPRGERGAGAAEQPGGSRQEAGGRRNGNGRSGGRDGRGAEEADEIFGELKKSRRDGRWHRTSWAMGFGFSSYARFFRACLLCYGKTPHEVEMEVIEELLREFRVQDSEVRSEDRSEQGVEASEEPKEEEVVVT